jgi:hypothetical protein
MLRLMRYLFRGLVLSATGLALLACSDSTSLGRLVPVAEVTPSELNFGDVPVGAAKFLSVDVSNRGTAQLSSIGFAVESPFSVLATPSSIPAGATVRVEVVFRPTVAEGVARILKVVSSDEANPEIRVSLAGTGTANPLSVRPSTVNFTGTAIGADRTQEIVLTSLSTDLIEGRILTDEFERPRHFQLTSVATFGEPQPLAVSPRSTEVLNFAYRPEAVGADNGRILFEFCGSRCGLEVLVEASASEARLRVDPTSLDFGDVGIGETRSLQIILQNTGSERVEVNSVTTRGGGDFSASSSRALPQSIAGGAQLAVTVEYSPDSADRLDGDVRIQTTDPSLAEAVIPVTGQGVGPLFTVSPERLDFGVQRNSQTYERQVLLLNAGSSEVKVTGIQISAGAEFGVGTVPGLPIRLRSKESRIVGVAFSPGQLGGYSGNLRIDTDDPDAAQVDVPLSGGLAERACELSISPAQVVFGVLPRDFERSRTVVLTNAGTDSCRLVSGGFRGGSDPALLSDNAPFPITLLSGQSVNLDFRYAPKTSSESKGTYVVMTDDPVFPDRPISLSGSASGYVNLFTEPNVLDFGEVRPDCVNGEQRSVTLFNTGTAAVWVDSLNLLSSTPEFQFLSPPSTPVQLVAGGRIDLRVRYKPADLSLDSGFLEIAPRELPYPLLVPLTGRGVTNPRQQDQFEQEPTDKVDVLFVIDDSCSMEDDQTALAANFSSFIRTANIRSVDFRLGVTTTNVFASSNGTSPGELVGPVLDGSRSNLASEFAAQANVGIEGSATEAGLEAMLLALQRSEQGFLDNQDLFRLDAAWVVVIVSDEDDQSNQAPVAYVREMRRRGAVSFGTAVISGQDNGCVRGQQGAFAEPAPRYEDFVQLTGGISTSICSSWSSTLSSIGDAAFGLRRAFSLSRPAEPNSVSVFVNGVLQSPKSTIDSPVGDYFLEVEAQAVIFETAPPVRANVVIEYTPACSNP